MGPKRALPLPRKNNNHHATPARSVTPAFQELSVHQRHEHSKHCQAWSFCRGCCCRCSVLCALKAKGQLDFVVFRHVLIIVQESDHDDAAERQLAAADPEQQKLMAEECILLDDNDKVIGSISKKACTLRTPNCIEPAERSAAHLMTNIDKGVLHRAFSVFLFNKKGELLLQKVGVTNWCSVQQRNSRVQRSPAKITFPHYWANTCCSHPLHREDELIADDYLGVKNAARRKMEQELGINPEVLSPRLGGAVPFSHLCSKSHWTRSNF